MTGEMFFLFVVSAFLVTAAGWDLATYTIPNFLPLTLLGTFVVFIAVATVQAPTIDIHALLSQVGIHALAGLAGFALGFALFAFGLIGGGDAKLFAVIVLWLGFGDLLDYALMTSVFGGALSIILIGLRSVPMPAALYGHAWLARLLDPRSGIPYGVALAAGALVVLFLPPYAEIFRMGAA